MERAVPLEGNKWLFLLFKFPVCRIVYGILPCHPHTISLALSQASLPHRLHSIDNKQSFHGEGDSRENSFRIPFSGSPLTTSRIELEISSDLNGNATHKGISGLVGGTISLLIVSRAAFIHISSVVLRKQHRKVGTRRTSRGRCERRNKSWNWLHFSIYLMMAGEHDEEVEEDSWLGAQHIFISSIILRSHIQPHYN
jgi:hypothetical protein